MKITKNLSSIALILSLSSEQCLAVINGGALIGAIDTAAGLASAISSQPSSSPSSSPTSNPTAIPSAIPSMQPSLTPSLSPSTEPSLLPSGGPSLIPSSQPSSIPTTRPTVFPSSIPSLFPSLTPSLVPTNSPSFIPSLVPSSLPTGAPSKIPTQGPTTAQKLQSSEFRPTNNDNDRTGDNNRGDNQQDFLVIILSSGIGALALVLGAVLFVFHRHKRGSLASEKSINDDDLAIPPREEPKPLPAPKEIKKQLSKQVNTGKATPMQMDMDMNRNRNMPRGDLSFDETDEGGLISEFDPSTIQSEKTSVWGKRIERDASYDIESKISGLSDFVLPSVFDPSTIRTEGSMARHQREPSLENFNFFSDESIPDQIFCIDEEDYEME